jgi:probable HAF family extracellular repeat protein
LKQILSLSLLLVSGIANAASYNINTLTALSQGGDSLAYALNDNGMVVGQSYNSETGLTEAVVWSGNSVTSIGYEGIARGVNNSGQVVGETGTGTLTSPDGEAFLWQSGTYTDLGTLGGANSGAYDINQNGVITGISMPTGGGILGLHAFIYENSTMTDLGTVSSPTGYSRGHGINDAGEIVGRASLVDFGGSEKQLAYWTDPSTLNSMPVTGSYSTGQQINNNGIIVGNGRPVAGDNTQFGMVWDENGLLTVLDTLGGNSSRAWSVNDAGIIVGWAKNASGAKRAIVSYDGGETIIDLNDLVGTLDGWASLDEAYDINENGQIVGYGTLSTGEQGAFVLSVVPIPATVWLFGSALGLLGWLRRRRLG